MENLPAKQSASDSDPGRQRRCRSGPERPLPDLGGRHAIAPAPGAGEWARGFTAGTPLGRGGGDVISAASGQPGWSEPDARRRPARGQYEQYKRIRLCAATPRPRPRYCFQYCLILAIYLSILFSILPHVTKSYNLEAPGDASTSASPPAGPAGRVLNAALRWGPAGAAGCRAVQIGPWPPIDSDETWNPKQ